jgi:hypothetical protein
MYEELGHDGFVPITVALDRAEDARPFIERANATHPSLVDSDHRVAELYHISNVPTMIWIDERGRICRPHDAQFGTDTFASFTGKLSAPYLDLLRAWVRDGSGAMSGDEVRRHSPAPTRETQLARAERALAWHLHQAGRGEAAERHFRRAGELAPLDWTIRRGSLPLLGENPFGPAFFELAKQGRTEYAMESVTPTRAPAQS